MQVPITQAELDQVLAELEEMRVPQRDFVDEARILQLERFVASATVTECAGDGAAGLGSVVLVEESGGARTEYELVGVLTKDAARPQVTPGSPLGHALVGARAGETVRLVLPNGRERLLTVLAVITAR